MRVAALGRRHRRRDELVLVEETPQLRGVVREERLDLFVPRGQAEREMVEGPPVPPSQGVDGASLFGLMPRNTPFRIRGHPRSTVGRAPLGLASAGGRGVVGTTRQRRRGRCVHGRWTRARGGDGDGATESASSGGFWPDVLHDGVP